MLATSGPCERPGTQSSGVSVVAGAPEDFYGVGQQFGDGVERFHRALRAAGQIDDDHAPADADDRPRKCRAWSYLAAFFSHQLAQPGNNFLANGHRGFRCDVAWANPGAAGSEDEVHEVRIGELD